MKNIILTLLILCCASSCSVFVQKLSEKDMLYKESNEIAYIIDCVKANKEVENLIEWEFSSQYDNNLSYKHKRSWLVFFELYESPKGVFLKTIDYYHLSFEKIIFSDDTLSKYEVNSLTRFRVWMSKDRLSIYFCMINPDSIMIWVLTNGDTVYTSESRNW